MKNPFARDSQTSSSSPHVPLANEKGKAAKQLVKKNNGARLARADFFTAGSGFFSFLLISLIIALAFISDGRSKFTQAGPLPEERIVYIPRGSNVDAIGSTLESQGVISDSLVFSAAASYFDVKNKLKAGEYKFPAHVSMADVMKILAEGHSIQYKLTLPEGLTSEQIIIRIYENDILTGDLTQVPLEGSLLPDTYSFPRGTNRVQFVQMMQNAQKKALERIWAKRKSDLVVKSPEELVILASIVEKETGKADERPRVAAVFSNRIKRGMRLQSDPTIIYGIIGGKGSLGRGLLRSEIDKLTPYNTYQINGLPPTPIANPGIAAMEAVANPSNAKDLYFVADGTGGHVFAETLEQHNRNVMRWRSIENERKPQPE